MLFFFFFTKSEEMSRVGSRDRHPRWRSNIPHIDMYMMFELLHLERVKTSMMIIYVNNLVFTTYCSA